MTHEPIESLRSNAHIDLPDGRLAVFTGAYAATERPVHLLIGPAGVAMAPEEAVELGSALIAAAHHWKAALAEYRQAVATVGTLAAGGEA